MRSGALKRAVEGRRRQVSAPELNILGELQESGSQGRSPSQAHRQGARQLLLLEHKRPVADNLVARAGCIAGVAQVHGARAQTMPARGLQEAANGNPAAGALLANRPGL